MLPAVVGKHDIIPSNGAFNIKQHKQKDMQYSFPIHAQEKLEICILGN